MAIYYQDRSETYGGTGALSVVWPRHLTNDIGVIIVQTANETVGEPTGWTRIGTEQGSGTGGSAGSVLVTAFYKRAASAAEGNVTVADPGDHAIAAMYTFRGGLESGDPIDVAGGDTASTSTSVTIPAITTTVDGCMVVACVANATDSNSAQIFTYPGMTNANLETLARRDAGFGIFQANNSAHQNTSGVGGGVNVATGRMVTAGDTGTTTATLGTTSVQARLVFAIEPEPDAGSSAGGGHVVLSGAVVS